MFVVFIHRQLVVVPDDVLVALDQVKADGTLEVLGGQLDLEVVEILARPNLKIRLVLLERHAETDLRAKHHL